MFYRINGSYVSEKVIQEHLNRVHIRRNSEEFFTLAELGEIDILVMNIETSNLDIIFSRDEDGYEISITYSTDFRGQNSPRE